MLNLAGISATLTIARMKLPLAFAAMLACAGCSDPCQNSIVQRSPSPDGIYTAILFQRDCGTTTGFSTQISILRSKDRFSGSGNIFRADDNHGAARAANWGGPWAAMQWLSPDHLRVRYAKKSRLFQQTAAVSGVKISYEEASR